ncbi:MAG: type II toxin-antitoxin system VapC family toxin [Acidobacteria bacterium]|nr:type II toxin-antitoxin system VapC family toxin [Acidobacteriota bacterium]
MNRVVFLDTSYAIALSARADQLHEPAVRVAELLESEDVSLVTTRAVTLEIGNALSKLKYRAEATELLQSLEDDPAVEIVPLTEELYERAYQLYAGRPDKEWGLTDCVSFVVMQDHGLTEALTADEHFRQAGFSAMLRES